MPDSILAASTSDMPDLTGAHYLTVLGRLHDVLTPKTYLEVGTCTGASLMLAHCATVAVDPGFAITDGAIVQRILQQPATHFYRMGSDDFFAAHDPTQVLGGPVGFAFLDGMHRCEYLLRDFINTERVCRRNSIIVMHDCLPVEAEITGRDPGINRGSAGPRAGWWAGDVWRTALLLKRNRRDLDITVLDASATGLVIVSNLDPASTALRDGYAGHVRDMMTWDLKQIGVHALFAELGVEPTSALATDEQITARFWL